MDFEQSKKVHFLLLQISKNCHFVLFSGDFGDFGDFGNFRDFAERNGSFEGKMEVSGKLG
jgi:hypothetical protein